MKWQISTNGGDWVRWSAFGEVFYVAPDRTLMFVSVRAVTTSLVFTNPAPLFALPAVVATGTEFTPYAYDVMHGGQRFLVMTPVSEQADVSEMTVLLDWHPLGS